MKSNTERWKREFASLDDTVAAREKQATRSGICFSAVINEIEGNNRKPGKKDLRLFYISSAIVEERWMAAFVLLPGEGKQKHNTKRKRGQMYGQK